MKLIGRVYWTLLIWLNYFRRYRVRKKLSDSSGGMVEERLRELQSKLQPLSSPDNGITRVGSMLDGGYYLPQDWTKAEALFSPGVGSETSFDEEFNRRGIPVFLMDPNAYHSNFFPAGMHFTQGYLAGETRDGQITLFEWISSTNLDSEELALQMDIEGAEYRVLERYLTDVGNFSKFRFIVIELHDLFEIAGNEAEYVAMNRWLDVLLETHNPVAVLPSCFDKPIKSPKGDLFQTLEVTFQRRDVGLSFSISGHTPRHKGFKLLPSRTFSTAARD